MSLPIDRFLTARLSDSPSAVQGQDQSLAIYATDLYSDQFIGGLYFDVSSQIEVEQAFGTASEIAKATSMAFSHPLKPKQIRIAFWNKNGIEIASRPNSLTATQAPAPFTGEGEERTITITSRNVTESKNFDIARTVDNFEEFATELNTTFGTSSRFTWSFANGVFAVTSKATGKDVDTDNIVVSGDFVDEMRLTASRGAVQVRGNNQAGGTEVTATEFIAKLDDVTPNYYGFYSSVELVDSELEQINERLQSALKPHVFAFTALADYYADFDSSNPLYRIAIKNNRQMLVQFNAVGEKHAAVQLLVEACSTNWEGNNTAKTIKFKRQPSVSADAGITTSIANKLDRLGINYYTDYDGTAFLAEGRTLGTEIFFIDSKVGRDALVDGLRVDAATRLIQQPKIPQTDEGQVTLEGSLLRRLEQFVRNGFVGKGLTWNSIGFGNLATGDILERGYYMFSESYTLQSQSDREKRKAMPIQIAVKEAGAIHSADILIYVER